MKNILNLNALSAVILVLTACTNGVQGERANVECAKITEKPGRELTNTEIESLISGSTLSPLRCLQEGYTPFVEYFAKNKKWEMGREMAIYTTRYGSWKVAGDAVVVRINALKSEPARYVTRRLYSKNGQVYIEDINRLNASPLLKGETSARYLPVDVSPVSSTN